MSATLDLPPIPTLTPTDSLFNIPLNSGAKDVDFTGLISDLKTKKWGGANYETREILLKAFGPKSEKTGEVDLQEAANPPCEVIKTVDNLWSAASSGKYGFTAQRQVLKKDGNNYRQAYSDMRWQRLDGKWLLEYELDDRGNNVHRYSLKNLDYNNLVKGELPTFQRGYNFNYSFDGTLAVCGIN